MLSCSNDGSSSEHGAVVTKLFKNFFIANLEQQMLFFDLFKKCEFL